MTPQLITHSHYHPSLLPHEALAVFESTPNPYLILRPDFTIAAVNDAYLAATSTVRTQILGRGIFEVFPDNPNEPNATGVANLSASLMRVLRTKKQDRMAVQKYDIPIPGHEKDKFEEHYWSPLNIPVLDGRGDIIYIIHHVEDVTSKVQATQLAAELEECTSFRVIANAMPQIVWTANPDGTINWSNEWFSEYTAADPQKIQLEWMEFIHPDDRKRVGKVWKEATRDQEKYSIDFRIRNANGDFRWHHVSAKPMKGETGEVLQWVGVALDIHELILAREKIQENEARFRAITNTVPQIVWSTRPDGYHDYFNERYYEFTGASQDSMYGENWIIFHHPEDRERLIKTWKHSLSTGEPYEIEYRMRHHSGEWRWVLGRALPVRNKEGKIVRWFGTCTDIHDQKQTQVALNEAIRDREMFFSIASHELKSPLTALGLQTQMQLRKLKNGGLESLSEENLRSTMEKINQQTTKLVRLVDEMLDVSRITSGKLTLELTSCDLCELIGDVLGRMTIQFQKAGVPVPQIEKCAGAQGHWDPMRIEQVITNLLTNALRYGNGKPIKVRLDSFESRVRFSVQDEGIGISEEGKKMIFNRFERVTSASKGQGLGLGLYITKEIVLAHGGKIWVESELGKGSTFYVELPRNS